MSQDLEERELDLITHFTSKFKVLEDLAAELNEVEDYEMDRGTKLNIIPDVQEVDLDSSILISSPNIQIDGNTTFPNSPTRTYD